jgi:hypothetical protein
MKKVITGAWAVTASHNVAHVETVALVDGEPQKHGLEIYLQPNYDQEDLLQAVSILVTSITCNLDAIRNS